MTDCTGEGMDTCTLDWGFESPYQSPLISVGHGRRVVVTLIPEEVGNQNSMITNVKALSLRGYEEG